MQNSNVIIVHGAYGHPEENWFEWLRQKLLAHKIDCLVPALPTPYNQSLTNWLYVFDKLCSNYITPNTILIGHSLGCAFILRWLEKNPIYLNSVFLVGAFLGSINNPKFDLINRDFFLTDFDWHQIKLRVQHFFCYYGDNDHYVTRANFDFIADHLHGLKCIISQGGHLNSAAGYSEFPQLLDHLLTII